MNKVYFKAVKAYSNTEEICKTSAGLLEKLINNEKLELEKFIPLKVHFGEKGNKTYIESKNYEGLLDYLKQHGVESAFIETNVLYKGERISSEKHKKLALEHGFTQLPVIIADGETGEEYTEVRIGKKHFETCKIAKGIHDQNQMLVLSHFKGHIMAGFGGAVKQLAMGCASKGGKLAQHANSIPRISRLKCKACKACSVKCPENAIILGKTAKIDRKKCVGCASCIAVCKYNAISNSWFASFTKGFNERLAEYALGASLNKEFIYITFAMNITKGCDCEGHEMKNVADDVGIFASTDPVAIDQACLDMLEKINRRKIFRRGRHTLEYAEKIGLGSRKYELVES